MSNDLAGATAPGRAINVAFSLYKSEQARVSRGRLYPLTVFYTVYSMIVVGLAMRLPSKLPTPERLPGQKRRSDQTIPLRVWLYIKLT